MDIKSIIKGTGCQGIKYKIDGIIYTCESLIPKAVQEKIIAAHGIRNNTLIIKSKGDDTNVISV